MDYTRPFNIAANAHTTAVLKERQGHSGGTPITLELYSQSSTQDREADPPVTAESSKRVCVCSSGRSSCCKIRATFAQLGSGPWRGTVDASVLSIDEIDPHAGAKG